jgi:multiple sugar transport system substrate-binding protein
MYWKGKRSFVALVMLFLAFCLTLSACGGNEAGNTVTNQPSGSTNQEKDTKQQGKVKITYAHWQDSETSKIVKAKAEEFHKLNPDIEVETISIPSNFNDKMKALAAAGELYDVFDFGGADFYNFAKKGYLAEVSDIYNSQMLNKSDFKETILSFNEVEGKTYAVPQTHNTMVIYYNADMFKQLGLETPQELMDKDQWTWDTFLNAAKTISASKDGKKYGFVFDPGWWGGYFGWISSNGGAPFDPQGQPSFNSPQAKEAEQFLYNGVKTGAFTVSQLLPKGVGLEQLFKTKAVGMFYSGRWSLQMLKDFKDFKYDIVPIPKSPAGNYGATIPWANTVISAKTKHLEAAKKWAAYFASNESMKDFVGYQGLPAAKSLDHLITDVGIPQHAQLYVDVTKYAVSDGTYPIILANPEVSTVFSKKMQDIFVGAKEGRTDVDRDTKALDTELKQIIAKSK